MAGLPSGIEFRHLRYFIAAADHGSFRKAATPLGIQESAISRRIRDLEDHLGASLFQRSSGGVRLTIAGERFQHQARAILAHVYEGIINLSAIGCGREGRIRIGLMASIVHGFPADLLREFNRHHDSVDIELVAGDPAAHIAALRRFDLDIAFLAGSRIWPGCDTAMLWSERVFVHLPEWHPLAVRTELAWTDLVDETFFATGNALGQELRTLVIARFAGLGYQPVVQRQNVGCESLLLLVALGRGVLLAAGTESGGCCRGITRRPIKGETIPFGGVWSPNNDNPAFRRFLTTAKAYSMHYVEQHALIGSRQTPGAPSQRPGRWR